MQSCQEFCRIRFKQKKVNPVDKFLHITAYSDKSESLLEFSSVLLFCQYPRIMKHNFEEENSKYLDVCLFWFRGMLALLDDQLLSMRHWNGSQVGKSVGSSYINFS